MSADAFERRIGDWSGRSVLVSHDKPTDSWIFIALHDFTLGPAVGGSRMKTYPALEDGLRDALRLAEGMTYKWAGVDLPFGGGKAVLAVPRPMVGEERLGLLRRYGEILRTLRGNFSTGVDLGTTPEDMQVVAAVAPEAVKGATADSTTDPGPYTAQGCLAGIRAALNDTFGGPDPAGRSFLIQGAGDVGLPLAEMLAEAGGELLISDLDAELAEREARRLGGSTVPTESVYDTPCDVFVPCAIGGILNPDTVPLLSCRIVAGSANNQLETTRDAERLHAREILYAPDYIINAGGAVAFGRMALGEADDSVLRAEVVRIERTLDEIFEEARRENESPVHAAVRRAERVLDRASPEHT